MIIILVVLIVGFFVIMALINNSKDNDDLKNKALEEKFKVIVNHLTNYAFDDNYIVKPEGKRHLFLLHSQGNNHKIELLYNQGVLSIIWKYKYLQKELTYKKHLNNVRNLSLIEQNKIGQSIVGLMNLRIQEFQASVWGEN
ncbi:MULTISPECIES: hypothetical protein [unclassified Polaribacter]|uniref:hypothetical protein n=1 Tax=unclassified Polaribacter TaxID=196858 RepID=UPI0011BFE5CE|nr:MULTISPECIES: hypothetical protein [unclassified Polaribacter]TXD53596.1 hypothetical protein ES043_02935 [Polaribacter sp. IC063]TXD62163.1 hypothetical protein ES044_02770 [Polaribacter sp. IC066]